MNALAALKIESLSLASELERDGIVVIPNFISGAQLKAMQDTFSRMLKRMRWNDFAGFEKTEPYRHMIQDLLMLDQGFVDAALHPMVTQTVRDYIGPDFALVEAKGWLSHPTKVDFNGWHGDCWYDQNKVPGIAREVKLAIYLSDVKSGAFNYIKGTHGKAPRARVSNCEVANLKNPEIVEVTGKAGTAILFDTSGTHRQGVPILEPRQAVFYCYHNPFIPLQAEDIAYNRYHSLKLNAAFLGNISKEHQRILGFGRKEVNPGFERTAKHETFQKLVSAAFNLKLKSDRLAERISARIERILKKS